MRLKMGSNYLQANVESSSVLFTALWRVSSGDSFHRLWLAIMLQLTSQTEPHETQGMTPEDAFKNSCESITGPITKTISKQGIYKVMHLLA